MEKGRKEGEIPGIVAEEGIECVDVPLPIVVGCKVVEELCGVCAFQYVGYPITAKAGRWKADTECRGPTIGGKPEESASVKW